MNVSVCAKVFWLGNRGYLLLDIDVLVMLSTIVCLGPSTHPEGLETAEDVRQSKAGDEEEPESERVLATECREENADYASM